MPVVRFGDNLFEAGMVRKNSAGNVMGHRLSFVNKAPAGDVKAVLKAQGLKGKDLKRSVRQVLAGERSLATVKAVAFVTAASERGFTATFVDSNKAGDKLTLKMEQGGLTVAEARLAARKSMTTEELEAELAERKAQAAKAPAPDGQTTPASESDKAGAVNV